MGAATSMVMMKYVEPAKFAELFPYFAGKLQRDVWVYG